MHIQLFAHERVCEIYRLIILSYLMPAGSLVQRSQALCLDFCNLGFGTAVGESTQDIDEEIDLSAELPICAILPASKCNRRAIDIMQISSQQSFQRETKCIFINRNAMKKQALAIF